MRMGAWAYVSAQSLSAMLVQKAYASLGKVYFSAAAPAAAIFGVVH